MLDILKSYGIYYIEIDMKTGERKEFIKGSFEDVFNAFNEIGVKGLWPNNASNLKEIKRDNPFRTNY